MPEKQKLLITAFSYWFLTTAYFSIKSPARLQAVITHEVIPTHPQNRRVHITAWEGLYSGRKREDRFFGGGRLISMFTVIYCPIFRQIELSWLTVAYAGLFPFLPVCSRTIFNISLRRRRVDVQRSEPQKPRTHSSNFSHNKSPSFLASFFCSGITV